MLTLSGISWVYFLAPLAGSTHDHHRAASLATLHWAAMIGAMMFPLLIGNVRVVANRSLWPRRNRAIALYLTGYLAPWMAYGAAAISALLYFKIPFSGAVGLLTAALWQLTGWKRRGLLGCHRTEPLTPSGWRADLDCLRSGWNSAGSCLMSCWALMLPCVGSPHSAWLMPSVAIFSWLERSTNRPVNSRFALALIAGAIVAALGQFGH